jgi:hypothetical protein
MLLGFLKVNFYCELKELLGDAVTLVIETIEKHINCFFVQALQLDPKT